MPACHLVDFPAGWGDAVYCRPFLHACASNYDAVYLATHWHPVVTDIPKVKVLDPEAYDVAGISHWTTCKGARQTRPVGGWANLPAGAVEVAFVREVGRSLFDRLGGWALHDTKRVTLSFPLNDGWRAAAYAWAATALPQTGRPRVLVHGPVGKPGVTRPGRDCDPALAEKAADLCVKWRLTPFDAAWVRHGESERACAVPEVVYQSDGLGGAMTIAGLVALADGVVTTSCHMVPLALAMRKPLVVFDGTSGETVHTAAHHFDPRVAGCERAYAVGSTAELEKRWPDFVRAVSTEAKLL